MLFRSVKDEHIYKTIDAGTTWTRISIDMPQVPVNDIEIDPYNANILYLATDMGVYYSTNSGINWLRLGKGMPNAVVTTLNYAKNSKQLYAATYGRSIYKIDVSSVAAPVANSLIASRNNTSVGIKIYPNPATTIIHISLPLEKNATAISIYSNKGDKVFTKKVTPGKISETIDISALQQGIYFLEYISGTVKTKQQFIISR